MDNIVAFDGTKTVSAEDLEAFDRKVATQSRDFSTGANGGEILRLNGRTGEWSFGREKTPIEEAAVFAVNIHNARWGWRVWDDGKPRDVLVSVVQAMPVKPELPSHLVGKKDRYNNHIDWKETAGFDLVCISGEDDGVEMTWLQDSGGAFQAFKNMMADYDHRSDVNYRTPLVRLSSVADKNSMELHYPRLEVIGWGDPERRVITDDPALKALAELPAPQSETSGAAGDEADAPEADAKQAPKRRRRRATAEVAA